ncbi:hypothetical protein OIDMADRAFT_20488 [Oidiodendron maius Zn]|uniref:Uncharacterized protein n=1 Tax=Oidiodendron maius (strain Zn) TaxID=913774 RepID=A0A0C3GMF2_OIDMZ|nr:hypothetical protein OIDMADRAFT_20488 [Oidiodendron maius Zn]
MYDNTTNRLPTQIIEGQHVDQQKLMTMLKSIYGTSDGRNNFRVELRLNKYKIYASEPLSNAGLTDDQIEGCRVYRRR